MGGEWVVCDEGLSHNGTFVNGEHVRGRRRAPGRRRDRGRRHADRVLRADRAARAIATAAAGVTAPAVDVTPAQRRVLVALCRPLRGSAYAAPASNAQIAEELVLSVDTVKGTLSALFERFGLEALPQNEKRAALAARALALADADQR